MLPTLARAALPLALVAPVPAATAEAGRDARPPAVAYTVVDGAGIETPLAEAPGDPLRGLMLFADPQTGGCTSCHAAPGLPRREAIPRLLADRLPPLPPPADEGPAPPATPAESPTATALAPERAPPPPVRPAGGPRDEAEAREAGPPLLPLPVGPDLAGVARRLSEAELRLTVVNPRILRPATRMPAYHHVSPALAARRPGLRQPWLDADEVEAIVAYLSTLTDPHPPGPRARPAPAAAAPAAAEPPPGPAPEAAPGADTAK